MTDAGETWDAVVVGAGPAGAVAARELARRGHRVLLAERAKFPRGKVCGCCLNEHTLSALAAAGLGDLPARLDATTTGTDVDAAESSLAAMAADA